MFKIHVLSFLYLYFKSFPVVIGMKMQSLKYQDFYNNMPILRIKLSVAETLMYITQEKKICDYKNAKDFFPQTFFNKEDRITS